VDWGGRTARRLPAIVPSPASPIPSPPLLDGDYDLGHSPEVAAPPGEERRAVSSSQQGEDLEGETEWPGLSLGFLQVSVNLTPGQGLGGSHPDAASPKQLWKALLKMYYSCV
jgi:hypothetical protein